MRITRRRISRRTPGRPGRCRAYVHFRATNDRCHLRVRYRAVSKCDARVGCLHWEPDLSGVVRLATTRPEQRGHAVRCPTDGGLLADRMPAAAVEAVNLVARFEGLRHAAIMGAGRDKGRSTSVEPIRGFNNALPTYRVVHPRGPDKPLQIAYGCGLASYLRCRSSLLIPRSAGQFRPLRPAARAAASRRTRPATGGDRSRRP